MICAGLLNSHNPEGVLTYSVPVVVALVSSPYDTQLYLEATKGLQCLTNGVDEI